MPSTTDANTGALTSRIQLVDVRLQESHAAIGFLDLPDNLEVMLEAKKATYRITEDTVFVRFVHHLEFSTPGPADDDAGTTGEREDDDAPAETRSYAHLQTAHIVQFSVTGTAPTDEDIRRDFIDAARDIAHPYVRADIQRLGDSVRLTGVVLPLRPTSDADVETAAGDTS